MQDKDLKVVFTGEEAMAVLSYVSGNLIHNVADPIVKIFSAKIQEAKDKAEAESNNSEDNKVVHADNKKD